MRGSKHVATIVPITEEHLELSSTITDAQAAKIWRELALETKEGRLAVVESARDAVLHLSDHRPRSRKASKKARRR